MTYVVRAHGIRNTRDISNALPYCTEEKDIGKKGLDDRMKKEICKGQFAQFEKEKDILDF